MRIKLSKLIDLFYVWKHDIFSEIQNVFLIKNTKVYLALTLISIIINFGYVYYTYSNINPESRELTALHYDIEFGRDLIGDAKRIFILPFLGLLFLLINFGLSVSLFRHKNFIFINHLLLGAALMANIILGFGVWSIYLINFK